MAQSVLRRLRARVIGRQLFSGSDCRIHVAMENGLQPQHDGLLMYSEGYSTKAEDLDLDLDLDRHATDKEIDMWLNAIGCLRDFLQTGLCVRDHRGRIVFIPLCHHDTELE